MGDGLHAGPPLHGLRKNAVSCVETTRRISARLKQAAEIAPNSRKMAEKQTAGAKALEFFSNLRHD